MLDLDSSKDALNEYFQANYVNQAASLSSVAPAAASSSAQQSFPEKDFVGRYRVKRVGIRGELRDYYSLPRNDFLLCDSVQ
jgi:hypothetical protein